MTEPRSILDEVRAHLEWEAAHGHAGIAIEAPTRTEPVRAEGPRRERAPDPAPVAGADEALKFLQALKAGPAPAPTSAAPTSAAPAPAPEPTRSTLPKGDKARLPVLAKELSTCTKCRLHEGRKQTVFARGSADAELLFVGEGPGFHEDQSGEPFVGAAGELLDKMVGAMGLERGAVYVCNVVKCRPPENRTPLPDEAAECMPYLREQIGIVAPKIIVALGRCAAENLGCALPGRSWRGLWGSYEGIPVMPTYHPAYLLRTPEMKRPVWEDLQKVMQRLKG